uniref:50S ribosomal protein L23 n=1 Tax=Phaeostrophion irregulare TaxID=243268 RepID=UPI002E78EA6F|nr:50S ribosomal protein L23 [Phaeostrophion irregulare]WAM64281.1 50S ribosomal protein L23 [Phaeostrophion irregulare]
MAQIDLNTIIDLIKYPLLTDKTDMLVENNQYAFLVDPKITKSDIKTAIEFLFDVKVIKVNSCNLPPKKRTGGKFPGVRPRYKKIMVKLVKENTINFFTKEKEQKVLNSK